MFIATVSAPFSDRRCIKHFAPRIWNPPTTRYQFEANRHYGIRNDHLANSRYMVRLYLTIVDLAVSVLGADGAVYSRRRLFTQYPTFLKRLLDEVSQDRASRALARRTIRLQGAEMDDEGASLIFRHLKTKAA